MPRPAAMRRPGSPPAERSRRPRPRGMMPPLSPNQPNPQPQGPTVLQYPSATGIGRGWTRQQVALGMLIGWVTMLPGLPLYLWWAHRSLAPTTGWIVPLSAYAAGVLAMLLAASS